MRPHDRFSRSAVLTAEAVARFARSAGDLNPLHHDPLHARGTPFGRIIASGTQTSSLLMGLTATHFSELGEMVGLEFEFRFRRPVFADQTIELEWLIVSVDERPRLGGAVVDLRGRVRTAAGETAVGAKGRVLVRPRRR